MGAMLAMSPYAISGFCRHAALNEIFILFEGRLTRGSVARGKAAQRQFCQNEATMYEHPRGRKIQGFF
jgi:hypothetical protein